MNWFFIALGAPFLWALVNISDQYLVKRYSVGKHGSGGLVLFSSLIGIFTAIPIAFFTSGIFHIPLFDKILLITIGGISVIWIIIYLFTIKIESMSGIVPWFLTVPVFGYMLGYIFLNETLSPQQILGSMVILLGVFLISLNLSNKKEKFKWKVATYMTITCFLIAISGVIFKYITVEENFWISSFWVYLGLGIFGIIIYIFIPKYRKEFMLMNKQGGLKIFILNASSEIITISGSLLTNYAILLAPITMVYLVGSFQPTILLFLTLFATKFFPNIIKEDLKKHVLIPKIIAIIIITLGSAILFM